MVFANRLADETRGGSPWPRLYDKIIFFNYNGASPGKKAAHATSVLNFNGTTAAPARIGDRSNKSLSVRSAHRNPQSVSN